MHRDKSDYDALDRAMGQTPNCTSNSHGRHDPLTTAAVLLTIPLLVLFVWVFTDPKKVQSIRWILKLLLAGAAAIKG